MAGSRGGAELRAKLVDEAADLAELRAGLEKASGRLTSARRGVGDEVLLRVDAASQAGDWRIATQASDWVLASPSSVVAGGHAGPETVDAVLADLEGAEVARLEVTDALSLVVVFVDGRWLEVQGLVDDPDEREDDPPYWEVLTPADELLRAGPGPIWVRSAASDHPPAGLSRFDVERLGDEELLTLWSGVTAELRRRGVVRTSQLSLGDVAEELVRKHFRGFRGSYDRAAWDVLAEDGERIEVKAIRGREGSDRLPPVLVRATEFDALVVVVFDQELSVQDAWHIPRAVVMAHLDSGHLQLRQALRESSVTALELQ